MRLHEYATRERLAEALASGVAAVLAGAIATRGSALLAVSGGATPALFLQRLSQAAIAWENVTVLPVDERLVPLTSVRSNARMIRHNLLANRAALARLVPLHDGGIGDPEPAQAHVRDRLNGMADPDAAVLGMGTDGHTASFFPGGDNLAEALDPACTHRAVSMVAPGAAEPRLTLSLRYLLGAEFIALHIEGEEKRNTLARALGEGAVGEMPVRALIRAAGDRLHTFYAP
jgi:6-phosphogluconolactonase